MMTSQLRASMADTTSSLVAPGFQREMRCDSIRFLLIEGLRSEWVLSPLLLFSLQASSFARFAFRRHFFQHLGFRVAKMNLENKTPARLVDSEIFILCAGCVQENPIVVQNVDESNQFISTNPAFVTETPDWLTKNLLMHYLPEKLNITEEARNYPVNCARLLLESAKNHGVKPDTALEIGCGLGRTSFEIARVASKVLHSSSLLSFVEIWHLTINQRWWLSTSLVDSSSTLNNCKTWECSNSICLAPTRSTRHALLWLPMFVLKASIAGGVIINEGVVFIGCG